MLRLLFSRKQFLNRGAVLLLPQAAFFPVRSDCFEISVRRRSAGTGDFLIELPGSSLVICRWRRLATPGSHVFGHSGASVLSVSFECLDVSILLELLQPAAGLAVDRDRPVVDPGIGVRLAVAQHGMDRAQNLVGGRDDSALVAAATPDGITAAPGPEGPRARIR